MIMSEAQYDLQPADGIKKRKRTGKQREERKLAAIQEAKLKASAQDLAEAQGPANAPNSEVEGAEIELDVSTSPTPAEGLDFEKIAKRIPQALKKLHPVFKQAKKEETMRLVKKIRFLRTKPNTLSEVSDLESQLKLLSLIHLHSIATIHLRQKLQKHHTLKRVALPEIITGALSAKLSIPASSSSATPALIAKVENRLCSAKPVADAIKPAVAWILSEPGAILDVRSSVKPKVSKQKTPGGPVIIDSEDDSDGDDESENGGIDDIQGSIKDLESDVEAISDEQAANEAGWESGSISGDETNVLADAAGWESGSVSGGDDGITASDWDGPDAVVPPIKKTKSSSRPNPPAKGKNDKIKGPATSTTAATSSIFLPSLASGFAAGDSDSDPDNDYDPDGIIGTMKVERKNRRGQRARQAIWEKKYGKNAKHVVKARKEEKGILMGDRDQGWGGRGEPAGRGGSAGDGNHGTSNIESRWGNRGGRAVPAPGNSQTKPVATVEKTNLHPSWEAARLRRQREMAGATGTGESALKPTKIVFD